MRPKSCYKTYQEIGGHLPIDSSNVTLLCKTKYGGGSRSAKRNSHPIKETTQMCFVHICVNTSKRYNYEPSIEIYRPTEYDYTANWCPKTRNPPPRQRFSQCKEKSQFAQFAQFA